MMTWYWVMLLGMAGGAAWTVLKQAIRWLVVSVLDARLDSKREAVARAAIEDPDALAKRLGLPVEVVRRYAEGKSAMVEPDPEGYRPG